MTSRLGKIESSACSLASPYPLRLALLCLALLPGCATLETGPGALSNGGRAGVWDVPLLGPAASSSGRALGSAFSTSGRALGSARTTTAHLTVRVLDSGPAPNAGFLSEPEKMVPADRGEHPFQRVWVSPDLERERYEKIVVAPVVLDHMLENSRWDKLSTATLFGLDDDAERLGRRLQERVEKAFREDPERRFEVGGEVDERTLILELALVELVPNKSLVALGALAAWAAPIAIGIPVGFVASQTEHGYVAIEGLVRDGGSAEVVAMFADRETAKTRVIDLQSIRWYGHAYEIIDDWAEQLVAVANEPASPGVKDPTPFTLKPW